LAWSSLTPFNKGKIMSRYTFSETEKEIILMNPMIKYAIGGKLRDLFYYGFCSI